MKYIDVHTHPYKEYYSQPEKEVEKNLKHNITKMFFVGTSIRETPELLELCKKFPQNLFPLLGIHPSEVEKENVSKLEKFIANNKIIGIGEIGLDYYHPLNPKREVQITTFKMQLDFALKYNLPVMLHVREEAAYEDVNNILLEEKYNKLKIVFHTYSGGLKWAKTFLERGYYLSFSGVITFKNAQETRDVVLQTPLNRLFVETDAPFLTPVPYRGKRNHSYYIKEITKFVANLKGVSEADLTKHLFQNAKDVFNV
ncbi:TatD family hydrolase [Candidatus Mycoplasma pogonae]